LSKPEKTVCDGLGFFGFGLFNPRVGLTNLPNPWVGFELLSETQSYGQATSEAAWNILKQRIKRRRWEIIAELKQVMLDEWDKIIMDEIRDRISDMSRRCRILTENGGEAIKGGK
jgi:hypothetical protein